jgi:hypothetical protein
MESTLGGKTLADQFVLRLFLSLLFGPDLLSSKMRDSGTVLDMLVQKVRRPRLTPSQIIESHLMFDSLTFTLEKIYGGNLLRRNFSLQDAQNCGIQKVWL